jgi:hypothetical protein
MRKTSPWCLRISCCSEAAIADWCSGERAGDQRVRGTVPVLFGGLRSGLSVVLVPFALMLLMMPSVPLLRPVLVWGLLPAAAPVAAELRVSAEFAPSSGLPLACA